MNLILKLFGNCARRFARWWTRVFYPRIVIEGAEKIPQSGPVLLAANHPNSLLDATIIGITAKRPVSYLAKAPLFDVPVFGALMKALGMLPAYRASDDASQVARNTESLSAGAEILADGGVLGIFPEGKTHDAPRIELVRSGAARIVMQAVQNGVKGLKVVPLGLTYERKEKFRSCVWVRVGDPVDAEEWLKLQENDVNKATRRMTGELDKQLKALTVHVNHEQWEPFLGDLENLLPPPREARIDDIAPLRQRKRIADAMNFFSDRDRARAESIAAQITSHQQKLAKLALTMHSPIMRLSRARLALHMLKDLLWLVLFFGVATVGAIHHLIPFVLVRLIAPRVQTPGNTTASLARLGLGIPIYAAWYGVVLWVLLYYEFRPWAICVWLLPMPLAGIVALEYWPRARDAAVLWWHQWRLIFRRAELAALRADRDALNAKLRDLSEEYARAYPQNFGFVRTPGRTLRTLKWSAATCCGIAGAWMLFQMRTPPIAELAAAAPDLRAESVTALSAQLDADEKALADIIKGLDELEARAITVRDEFAAGNRSYYTQADNDAVRQLLLTFLNYRAALFRIVWKYQKHEQVADDRLRLRAFLCNYTAASVLHEAALKLVTQFDRSAETIKKLNEAEPVWNIPPRVYDTIRANMTRRENATRLAEAFALFTSKQPDFERFNLAAAAPHALFHAAIARSVKTTEALAPSIWKEKAALSIRETQKVGKYAAYEIQTMIACWIGDTKIRAPRHGRTLISHDKLEKLKTSLKPGDILLERRNWFLSNAFLPGYWPHAAMYCGTPEDLVALGLDKDPRVAKHWQEYSARDEHGHPHVIVEALSEGVVCATLEHSIGGGDSVAVLRPKLPPEKVKEAICRAFSHAGKPYDFEFDFFSTDKIVCTELVFRCYDGEIQFTLVDVMGTKTLPAIEMVRKFNAEYGTPEAQLDLVIYLDGDEKTGDSEFKDVKAFMHTIKRPGMTWLQGIAPEE